jgi:hypothetical protein
MMKLCCTAKDGRTCFRVNDRKWVPRFPSLAFSAKPLVTASAKMESLQEFSRK